MVINSYLHLAQCSHWGSSPKRSQQGCSVSYSEAKHLAQSLGFLPFKLGKQCTMQKIWKTSFEIWGIGGVLQDVNYRHTYTISLPYLLSLSFSHPFVLLFCLNNPHQTLTSPLAAADKAVCPSPPEGEGHQLKGLTNSHYTLSWTDCEHRNIY